ncbi:MAG TPA: TerB family tellurite resistance protein [Pseudomonadales bacterium]|nr:TerB family tellurite resistance protein [Pseudomonadales bacterium]
MIAKLKRLLADFNTAVPAQRQHTIELAAACLLVELSRADMDSSADERIKMSAALGEMFTLSQDEIAELIAQAEGNADLATSTYEFTTVIKDHFDDTQRVALITALWRVAYADGVLDRYEEHFIRKVSDLLYVSHSDFIRAKHSVQSAGH